MGAPSLQRAKKKDSEIPSQLAHFGHDSPKDGQLVLGSYHCPRERKTDFISQ